MVNSRWLNSNGTGDFELEQEIASNRNKLAKCYDHVILDGQDLILSNELSGVSATIGLPSGGSGSGSFTAHNSVFTTGRQIIFGLSTGGNHAANM